MSRKASSRDGIVSRKALNHMTSVAAPNVAQSSLKLIFFSQFPSLSPALKETKYFILLKVHHNTKWHLKIYNYTGFRIHDSEGIWTDTITFLSKIYYTEYYIFHCKFNHLLQNKSPLVWQLQKLYRKLRSWCYHEFVCFVLCINWNECLWFLKYMSVIALLQLIFGIWKMTQLLPN
jgi:hypothetical protein